MLNQDSLSDYIAKNKRPLSEYCQLLQKQNGGGTLSRLELEAAFPRWQELVSVEGEQASSDYLLYYNIFVQYPLCWLLRVGNYWEERSDPLSRDTLAGYLEEGGSCAVSFGRVTCYGAFDVDKNSQYHPDNAGWEHVRRLIGELEISGISTYVILRSSSSGGIHVFVNFGRRILSDAASLVLASCAHKCGITIFPGQLEIFPSVRSSEASDHNQLRLPLSGRGSSLLFSSFSSTGYSSLDSFAQAWEEAGVKTTPSASSWIEEIDIIAYLYPETSALKSLVEKGVWK